MKRKPKAATFVLRVSVKPARQRGQPGWLVRVSDDQRVTRSFRHGKDGTRQIAEDALVKGISLLCEWFRHA